MGLLDIFFGRKQGDLLSFPRNLKADASLKRATDFKSDGNLDKAIEELRAFRRHAENGTVSFPVASYLRLPLYLQAAGRREEAWVEFYRLIDDGYPNQLQVESVKWMEKSTVYDKMRLFLERDKSYRHALFFSVLAIASAWRGRYLGAEINFSNLGNVRDVLGEKEYREALLAEKERSEDEISSLQDETSKIPDELIRRAKKAGIPEVVPSLSRMLTMFADGGFDFIWLSNEAVALLLPEQEKSQEPAAQ